MKKYIEVFSVGWKYLRGLFVNDTDNFLVAIFGIIVLCVIVVTVINDNDMDRNVAYTVGIITKVDISSRTPGKNYKYYVNGICYKGKAGIGGLTKIKAGDSVIVAYDRMNPKNSAIGSYFQYRLDRSKLPDTVYYRQLIDNQRKQLN